MIFHVIRLLHFIENSGLGCCLCASIIDAPISLLDCCQRQFRRWNNQTNSQNQQIKFKMSVHKVELKDEKDMLEVWAMAPIPIKVIMKTFVAVKTCGLPRITSVMRNLTLDPGDTAR